MNTIDDVEEVEAGDLLHQQRRSKYIKQDACQAAIQAIAVSIIDNALQVGRNRASLARLYKLNKELSPEQIALIKSRGFGGLTNIARKSPNSRELVIPEKGRIAVTAESVHRNFKLPNTGKKGKSPLITYWCKMINDMKGKADDKFLRAWLIAAMSCLVCPTTSLHVSPRCYPNFINLNDVVNINFCEFVADQIHEASLKLGDKSSVKCCVYHLLILYLDSLDIDEPMSNCHVRIEAWTTELINKVVQLDTKEDGGYGKLDITNDDSLFKGLAHAEKFVSSNSIYLSCRKKRKIAIMLGELCTDISQKLGKFVEAIGELHDEVKKRQLKPAATRNDKKKRGNEVVKTTDHKDDKDGQDAKDASKSSDKQVMKEGGEVTVEEVDDKKEQEEDEDDDQVAGDHHRGADRGDDGDGGQGGQASNKNASQTDSPILDKWLRNSSKTKDGNTASPSKGISRLHKPEATSPTEQLSKVADPKLSSECCSMDKAAVDNTKLLARHASAKAVKVARKYKKIVFRRNLTLPAADATQGIKGAPTEPPNKGSQATEAIGVKEKTKKIEATNLGG
ncbi:hypothetical protein BRADI_5g08162v3 [Brachypodium distachyon]|uniref:Uncharacterized protein n=1 Tax=Brachypodium distachyon TaxID=15368 RepID=A0A2K2CFX0_BRADI|nr:hypothetical protein BRADI_5g08162v3 [Brachypodium distachyon]